jgi:hypothetical protein
MQTNYDITLYKSYIQAIDKTQNADYHFISCIYNRLLLNIL